MEALAVVVGADPGLESVVPAVQATDQVVTFDPTVGHQGAAVQAPAVEHRRVVTGSHDDQVDPADQGSDR